MGRRPGTPDTFQKLAGIHIGRAGVCGVEVELPARRQQMDLICSIAAPTVRGQQEAHVPLVDKQMHNTAVVPIPVHAHDPLHERLAASVRADNAQRSPSERSRRAGGQGAIILVVITEQEVV